jgi:hypothetical protein
VVNAHRQALRDGIKPFMDACREAGDWNQPAADALLASILGARDSDTTYVVGTRYPSGATEIYGPYATVDAANKAIDAGVCAHSPGAVAGIFPLIPAPKPAVRSRSKKRV